MLGIAGREEDWRGSHNENCIETGSLILSKHLCWQIYGSWVITGAAGARREAEELTNVTSDTLIVDLNRFPLPFVNFTIETVSGNVC